MRSWWPLAVLLAVLAPLAQAADVEVRLGNGFFEPSRLVLEAGASVLFVNVDGRAHTVTSTWDDGEALDVVLRPGDAVPVAFPTPGLYELRCVPHSTHEHGALEGMVAAVEVEGGPASSASAAWPFVGGLGAVALIAFGALRLPRRAPASSPR